MRMRWAGHEARMGTMRIIYKFLIVELEGNRLLGRSMRRWEENIRMYLRDIEWEIVEWTHLAQDTDQWAGSCDQPN
jgi:hypothetical protein